MLQCLKQQILTLERVTHHMFDSYWPKYLNRLLSCETKGNRFKIRTVKIEAAEAKKILLASSMGQDFFTFDNPT